MKNSKLYAEDPQYKRWLHSARWKRLRTQQLIDHPWCEDCQKAHHRTLATEVHHRQPVLSVLPSEQEGVMFSPGNLVSLCAPCHKRRHDRRQQRANQQQREHNRLEAFKRKYGINGTENEESGMKNEE